MQVLKFGGTSVANSKNISRVVDIVASAVERDRTILVCSAISGFTDALIKLGNLAAAKDESYKQIIDEYRQRHETLVRDLLPQVKQKECMDACNAVFDSLTGISQGVFLLGELSDASLDAIQGCGELLSTRIIAAALAVTGIAVRWVDSRDIVKTVKRDGVNTVDTSRTYSNVVRMLEDNPATSLFVLPGFIASDSHGRMTTLGRGGSDYSASLMAVGCDAQGSGDMDGCNRHDDGKPQNRTFAKTISHISYRAAFELFALRSQSHISSYYTACSE